MTGDPTALDRLLTEQTNDLRRLDLAGFRRWLGLHLPHWERDPVFTQRVVVRELRRANPAIRELEEQYRRAQQIDTATPAAARFAALDAALANAARAIDGITAALAAASPERRADLETKRHGFRHAVETMSAERETLVRSSPGRQSLLRAAADLDQFRGALGLDREEAKLADLLTQRAHRAAHAGETFETTAEELVRRHVLPGLDAGAGVLHGVRLGAARLEFDLLVVRDPGPPGPVEVLGAGEAKRNINDLAHGFRHRQDDLTWLTGDRTRYDPAAFVTRSFPTGHFDRESVHREGGHIFRFGPDSFRRFTRDPATNYFLDGLFLITRPGPMWGVSSAALARTAARVATDECWDLGNDAYLSRLLPWCRGLAYPVETPDVLRLYAATPNGARQVLLADR